MMLNTNSIRNFSRFPTRRTLTNFFELQFKQKLINGNVWKAHRVTWLVIEFASTADATFRLCLHFITLSSRGRFRTGKFIFPSSFLHHNRKYYPKEISRVNRNGSFEQTHHGLFIFCNRIFPFSHAQRKICLLTMIMFAHHSWKSRRNSNNN